MALSFAEFWESPWDPHRLLPTALGECNKVFHHRTPRIQFPSQSLCFQLRPTEERYARKQAPCRADGGWVGAAGTTTAW